MFTQGHQESKYGATWPHRIWLGWDSGEGGERGSQHYIFPPLSYRRKRLCVMQMLLLILELGQIEWMQKCLTAHHTSDCKEGIPIRKDLSLLEVLAIWIRRTARGWEWTEAIRQSDLPRVTKQISVGADKRTHNSPSALFTAVSHNPPALGIFQLEGRLKPEEGHKWRLKGPSAPLLWQSQNHH